MIDAVKKFGGVAAASMDIHLKELIGKGSIAFAYRIVGVGLVFLLQIVLARKMGAFEFGLYSLSISLAMLLASVARLGLDLGVVKKVAEAITSGNPGNARAWLVKSLQTVLLASVLAAAVLALLSEVIATAAYKEPRLARPLTVFALTIPAIAVMYIVAEGLKGLKDIANAAIVQHIIVPLLLLAILFSIPVRFAANEVALAYLGVTLVSFAYGYYRWISIVKTRDIARLPASAVVSFGWPFFLANLGSMLLTWSDTIIVGFFANAETVASYYAASKLATVTSFILISINAISAPKFTAFHTLGDCAGLVKLARQSTAIMIALASVPTILLVAFPGFWLGLFGQQFEQASAVLLILTAGQVVNVSCGSVGLLLAMTGHERTMSRIFLTTALVTICCSVAAGMKWGAAGVAVATATGMATWNIWMLVAVRRHLGFWTFPLLFARNHDNA